MGRAGNPYVDSLTEKLVALGAAVDPMDLKHSLLSKADAVLVHWPEHGLKAPKRVDAVKGVTRTLLKLVIVRLRGIPVIWTVHNLGAHGGRHRHLERLFWKLYIPLVSAEISLSKAGQELARQRFPAFRSLPSAVIPHPHYRAALGRRYTKSQARRQIEVEAPGVLFGLAGRLTPYKGVEELICAFWGVADVNARLILVGEPESEAFAERLRDLADRDARVILRLAFLTQAEMSAYVAAMDLVVLPYRQILNSGTALFALSVGRPVLLPRMGALGELSDSVGPEWVRTFEPGQLDGRALKMAGEWAISSRGMPELPGREWEHSAAQTLLLVETLRPPSRRRPG